MKQILIGLTLLTSISAFSSDCRDNVVVDNLQKSSDFTKMRNGFLSSGAISSSIERLPDGRVSLNTVFEQIGNDCITTLVNIRPESVAYAEQKSHSTYIQKQHSISGFSTQTKYLSPWKTCADMDASYERSARTNAYIGCAETNVTCQEVASGCSSIYVPRLGGNQMGWKVTLKIID